MGLAQAMTPPGRQARVMAHAVLDDETAPGRAAEGDLSFRRLSGLSALMS